LPEHLFLLPPEPAIRVAPVDISDQFGQQQHKQHHNYQLGDGIKQRQFGPEFQLSNYLG
jgi:hypothetical protein